MNRSVKLTVFVHIRDKDVTAYAISEYSKSGQQEKEMEHRVATAAVAAAQEIYLNDPR